MNKTWPETTASKCRWAEYAAPLFRDWRIIFDASERDYQGTVEVIAVHGWRDEKFKYLEYSYGSCSVCDCWEDEPDEYVMAEMLKLVLPLDRDGAVAMLKRIADEAKTEDDYDARDRSKKARAALAELQKESR